MTGIGDYFFFDDPDRTILELNEYEDGLFGFYFNHIGYNGSDSYQPVFKCLTKEEVLDPRVIEDIYKFLENHINFMNSLNQ